MDLGIVIDPKKQAKYPRDIEEINKVLEDQDLFQQFADSKQEILEKSYENYRKNSYSDEKFELYEGPNFTAFIDKYLKRRLIDLYRRKELKNKPTVSLDDFLEQDESMESSTNTDFTEGFANDMQRELDSLLTPNERTALRLRLEGYPDIAIAQNLKVNKSRIPQLFKNISKKAKKLGLSA